MWRYLFTGDAFVRDTQWDPIYADRLAGEQPGTACGMLDDWVVIQTNFLRADAPLRISAFHVDGVQRAHTVIPFPDSMHSQEFSKPALDPATMGVYTNDQAAHRVAGLRLDPEIGFVKIWEAHQTMFSFRAIVGPIAGRNIIGTDFTPKGDRVIWRDAEDGREPAVSDILDRKFNAGIVATGFDGNFYYLAQDSGKLMELSLSAGSAPASPDVPGSTP